MNYEKKYKEALERAKKYHEGHTLDVNPQSAMEYVFPELKESEDERIRKEIIRIVDIWTGSSPVVNGIPRKTLLAWLEKQGEKKSADKAEPKFKFFDWIINNDKRIAVPTQILKIEKNGYLTSRGYILFDKVKTDYHRWTIEDAKGGDVLWAEDGWTYIIKALDNHTNTFSSYCFMDDDGWFCYTGSERHTLDKTIIKDYCREIHPATNNQRNILFQKMKEAGYEWDAEKKELRKIDFTWSEEDEKMFNAAIGAIGIADYYTYDDKQEIENWLKSIKDRMKGGD